MIAIAYKILMANVGNILFPDKQISLLVVK
jgi:hypothetical protein